jgi:hypothetical protein
MKKAGSSKAGSAVGNHDPLHPSAGPEVQRKQSSWLCLHKKRSSGAANGEGRTTQLPSGQTKAGPK